MGLRNSKKHGVRSGRPREYPRTGSVRRSQLITTYGVGAMLAIGEQSFIVTGLDSWKPKSDHEPALTEFRLQNRLRVKGFRFPPAMDPPEGDGVRIRRFPEWYSCPGTDPRTGDGCRSNLDRFRKLNPSGKGNTCESCGGSLTPSRFVMVCDQGHLDDFPYWEWVHRKNPSPGRGRDCSGGLSLRTTGRTASLRNIVILCSCGKSASMEGAFGAKALNNLGITCSGRRPWLRRAQEKVECTATPRVMQRGSSAAWFPILESALSIPPYSETLHSQIIDKFSYFDVPGLDDHQIRKLAENAGLGAGFDLDDVVQAVHSLHQDAKRIKEETEPEIRTRDTLRAEEYQMLIGTHTTEEFECRPPEGLTTTPIPAGLDEPRIVPRLREVRALTGFTRVDPPMPGDLDERRPPLSATEVDWLPGIEVIGEGVFFRLDRPALETWEAQDGPLRRAAAIRRHHEKELKERSKSATPPESWVSARFVLLHTLAHILINEWSLDAGYPAASLRERLYVSEPGGPLNGLLIYTATSDSAGSLGGLISQGEPQALTSSLMSALRRASWCSADPLCLESEASGRNSLNLAACHACVLLPEVSCECDNSFLDRAMLIGTPDGSVRGYFQDLLEE